MKDTLLKHKTNFGVIKKMTVDELFAHFSIYFNKIIYSDETNKIKGYIESKGVKTEKYDNFKNRHGSSQVIEWFFDNYNNKIVIYIQNKK